jgi:protein-S-isoprenylcysteine O-methyltransferase Ste14
VLVGGFYVLLTPVLRENAFLWLLAVPVALGSLPALVPAALIAAAIIGRTVLEDRTLHAELPGYPEYAARVRWRLVPHVF